MKLYQASARGETLDWEHPNYTPEFQRRAVLLQRLRNDPAIHNALRVHYRVSVVDFLQDWGMTFDPRGKPAWRPFLLWEKQVEFLGWLGRQYAKGEDGLVEKSRDMGVTWLCVGFAIHHWLFIRGFKCGFGSRKEGLVDKLGDSDSILEKGRMMLRHIPPEFMPRGYLEEKHAMHLRFINPDNGGTITGEGGDNIGRGGRNAIYFVDEAGFLQRPLKVEGALSANTNCRIDVSTVPGPGTPFQEKRDRLPEDNVFIFDWRDDPRKNQEWRDRQDKRFDPMTVAREIDRDYGAAGENMVIPGKWVEAAVNYQVPMKGQVVAGLDVADEGADANALCILKGVRILVVQDWHKGNTTQTTHKALALCAEWRVKELRFDRIGVGAGVKGTLEEMEDLALRYLGIAVSSSPTPGWYIEPTDKEAGVKNVDFFKNLRAQAWWELRRRFERTWEVVNGVDTTHDWSDCISIPDDRSLRNELSSLQYKYDGAGRVQIESKEEAKRRGIRSPNRAEGLLLALCPVSPKEAGVW